MEEAKNEIRNEQENRESESKKIKNLISVIILLAGLLAGSVFVDIAQMIRGKGFSEKNISTSDILEAGGKTWVAYEDPIVRVKLISDDSCEACNSDEALVWLQKVVPTILTQKIDQNSKEGKKILDDFEIKTIPAFIFSKEIEHTLFFQQAGIFFSEKNGQYNLNTAEIGIPAGKYVEAPKISDSDIKIGSVDAKIKIVEFSDFQCSFCKTLHSTVTKIVEEYKDKAIYVYKHFPLNFHPQAENAALASECANEQGKFMSYANKLFAAQNDWSKSQGTAKFKTYAQELKLNATQFNSCLDEKKYLNKVKNDFEEGRIFNVSGTPAIFINQQFKNGVVSYDTLKEIIEQELAK